MRLFLAETAGTAATEYGLLAGLIAAIFMLGAQMVGSSISQMTQDIMAQLVGGS